MRLAREFPDSFENRIEQMLEMSGRPDEHARTVRRAPDLTDCVCKRKGYLGCPLGKPCERFLKGDQ